MPGKRQKEGQEDQIPMLPIGFIGLPLSMNKIPSKFPLSSFYLELVSIVNRLLRVPILTVSDMITFQKAYKAL